MSATTNTVAEPTIIGFSAVIGASGNQPPQGTLNLVWQEYRYATSLSPSLCLFADRRPPGLFLAGRKAARRLSRPQHRAFRVRRGRRPSPDGRGRRAGPPDLRL